MCNQELRNIINEIVRIKREIRDLNDAYDNLWPEFLRLWGSSEEIYENEHVTIYPREDREYMRFNFDLLRQNLLEFINEDTVDDIMSRSRSQTNISGGITVRIRDNH